MSTATDMLARYLAAELAILDGKEIRWDNRQLRFEDLAEIRAGRKEWESRVAAEQSRRAGVPTLGGLTVSRTRFNG